MGGCPEDQASSLCVLVTGAAVSAGPGPVQGHGLTSCLLHVSGVDTSHAPALLSLSPCSEARVTQFLRQFVASCLLVSDSSTELSYVLPSEAVRKGCFQRLFQVACFQMLTFSLDALC